MNRQLVWLSPTVIVNIKASTVRQAFLTVNPLWRPDPSPTSGS
ncbi:MAG: hypothetical protein P8J01_09220 [Acidimicrobiales bacterium]|nr:hypothetical protein [Acidimicrobiales bacterium]